MKKLKFGMVALALGLFVASCGSGDTTDTEMDTNTDMMDEGTVNMETNDMYNDNDTMTLDTTMDGTNNTGTGTGNNNNY